MVQNLNLPGGMAPTCCVEPLIYDCRLMNAALAEGPDAALLYRKWRVASDAPRDPQAFVLAPASAVRIARAIVAAPDPYHAGPAAASTASKKTLAALPSSEPGFITHMMGRVDRGKFVPGDYGLD